MSTFRNSALAFLSAMALTACSSSDIILQSYLNRSTYDYSNFDLYHGNRDTRVLVYGNPFGIDQTAFANAVTRDMEGANPGPRTNFTTTPKNAEKNLYVVMAFDTDAGGYSLCSGKPVSGKPQSSTITLHAAWCWSDSPQSVVEAHTKAVNGVNDPRFRSLVQQTVLNLFPREVPVRQEEDQKKNPILRR